MDNKKTVQSITTKMKTKQLTLIIIVLIFAACSSKTKELQVVTPASLTQNQFNLSEIAEDLVYLKLDNTILLSNIRNFKKSESGYFVSTSDGLFHYNNKGKLLSQIGKKGKGPGEYTFVNDFEIDEETKLIYILSSKQILVYSSSGIFQKSFPTLNEQSFRKIYLHNKFLVFPKGFGFSGLESEWFITDLNGNLISSKANFLKVDELRVDYLINSCFKTANKLYYWNQLNDTVFQISEEEATPAYLFAQDKFRITENDLASEENFRNKSSWQLISILGTKDYLFFEYLLIKNGLKINTMFDKNKNTMYKIASTNLGEETADLNDFDNGPAIIPASTYFSGSEEFILGWVNSFHLKMLVESEEFLNSTPKYPEKKKALEKLANSLNENDNPVLMLVKLKE